MENEGSEGSVSSHVSISLVQESNSHFPSKPNSHKKYTYFSTYPEMIWNNNNKNPHLRFYHLDRRQLIGFQEEVARLYMRRSQNVTLRDVCCYS